MGVEPTSPTLRWDVTLRRYSFPLTPTDSLLLLVIVAYDGMPNEQDDAGHRKEGDGLYQYLRHDTANEMCMPPESNLTRYATPPVV